MRFQLKRCNTNCRSGVRSFGSSAALATALIDCKLRGVAVEEAASFHEKLTGKLWVKSVESGLVDLFGRIPAVPRLPVAQAGL